MDLVFLSRSSRHKICNNDTGSWRTLEWWSIIMGCLCGVRQWRPQTMTAMICGRHGIGSIRGSFVSGCSESSSSAGWNDSTSNEDNEPAAGLDRSPTTDDVDQGGTQQLGSRQCRTNADCEASVGVSCYWLYDGCQTGRCMCDPRRHLQSIDGHCIPRKMLMLLLLAVDFWVCPLV